MSALLDLEMRRYAVAEPVLGIPTAEPGQPYKDQSFKPRARKTVEVPSEAGCHRYQEAGKRNERIIYYTSEAINVPCRAGLTQGGYELAIERGLLHREDGPAVVKKRADGSVRMELWLRFGKLHREDGPAETEWRLDGDPDSEHWYLRGQLHRDPAVGPAITFYGREHKPQTRCWYFYGRKERQA